jgi:hypothetical protein
MDIRRGTTASFGLNSNKSRPHQPNDSFKAWGFRLERICIIGSCGSGIESEVAFATKAMTRDDSMNAGGDKVSGHNGVGQ